MSKHQPIAPAESSELLAGDAFDREALALAERSAGVGVWSIDLTTSRLRATAQFYRIMGLDPTGDSIPIESIRALRHPDDRERVLAGFREALQNGGDSYEIEYRIIRPDGNLRWIFGRGRVIRDRNGVPVRCSGVDLDITDRKATEVEAARRAQAESHLHQAQKMEAVGQLTGGIAHDFNNILQVITGNLEIIRMKLEQDPQDEDPGDRRKIALRATATARRTAQSAKELVQRLLAFSRQQPLAPAALDVNILVGEMTEMIARVLGVSIEIETALVPGVWPVRADRKQLESALLNLVVNARDAMPQGGRLLIETLNTGMREATPDDLTPGQYVMLSVNDTGCGIPPEHMARLFEPFFTTKDIGTGSGLGLSMVHAFVKQSGGHVRVDSEVGCGTTVKIFLPRATVATSQNAAAPAPGSAEI